LTLADVLKVILMKAVKQKWQQVRGRSAHTELQAMSSGRLSDRTTRLWHGEMEMQNIAHAQQHNNIFRTVLSTVVIRQRHQLFHMKKHLVSLIS